MSATPIIRRSGQSIFIENGVGKVIALIRENDIQTEGLLTRYELDVVNMVASNFDLFHAYVIEE